MKNTLKALIILAFFGLSLSCTKVNGPVSKTDTGDYVTFNATVGDEVSKTFLDGVQVKWNATDEINVWYGKLDSAMTGCKYFIGSIDGTDARKATFNGFAVPSITYMAVYPYSEINECSKKGKLTITIPMVQKSVPGSFAPGANVSVAYSTTSDLSFQNIGGLLAVKVLSTGGHTVKSIRLTGTSALSGEVAIKQASIAKGNPVVDEVTEGVNYIDLNFGDGVSNVDESLSYYLVALPGTHTSFVMTFVDSEGKTTRLQQTAGLTIERNGNTLLASVGAPSDASKWRTDPTGLYINEIFCHEDRIELWNSNDFDIDLSGWMLVKDEKSWAFPLGSSIAANGYKVVCAGQTDCSNGPTFGVSGDKGFVLSLVNGSTVDCIDNSGDDKKVIGETETFGRRTDGSDEWVIFSKGTIYEEGVCDGDNSKGTVKGDEPATATVVLNEINGNDKYAELYNYGSKDADITGWMLEKDGKTVWTATDASQCTIAAGGYLAIDFVSKSTDPKEASSGISAKKNLKLALQDASGNDVDVFKRGEKGEGWGETTLPENKTNSFSRTPDGTGAWKYAAPTKGTANGPATGTIEQYPAANGNVVLNELDGNSKFIELYNTSTDWPVSLEDVTLYKDDDETEAIWTGAPGYAVAPGGYVLLYSEDVIGSHPEHDAGLVFASGLSPKKTLKIELRDAAGTSLDIFTRGEKGEGWGAKISECTDSYGRVADGIGAWYLTQSTPGAANVATTDPPTAIPQK